MEAKILATIKSKLNISAAETCYDADILSHINSALFTLFQLGVGGSSQIVVSTEEDTWDVIFPAEKCVEVIKTYIHLKTKLVFDPPTNTTVLQAIMSQLAEAEWRIREQKSLEESATS